MDYEVIVIGGGIHGAGVAQAATARGYRTLLLEKTALASGTSSRSSKLIHGGLRYLESAQFNLVRKSLYEREVLLRVAPELVSLQPFYIPIYAHSQRRPWLIRLGLSLYAALGGFKAHARFKQLHRDAWTGLAGLQQAGLQRVFQYWDAQTDDVALTRAVMYSALELGAAWQCPAEVVQLENIGQGVTVHYQDRSGEHSVTGAVIINATGAWANQLLARMQPRPEQLAMDLVQGTHLVVNDPAPNGVYYVEAPQDKRVVFVMPWYGATLIGTTETLYTGQPEQVVALPEEIDYLLTVYRHYFPAAQGELQQAFAGLRVLPRASGSAFSRPRDTIIHRSAPRCITLYGGKLTGYRITAQQVLQRAQRWLPPSRRRLDTARITLRPVSENEL